MRSILVGTGSRVALFHARDRHQQPANAILESNPAVLATTWPVVTEACHFLGQAGKRALLTFIRRGALRLEPLTIDDVPGLDGPLARYERMDFADATLVLAAGKMEIAAIFRIDGRDSEACRTPSGRRFLVLLAWRSIKRRGRRCPSAVSLYIIEFPS